MALAILSIGLTTVIGGCAWNTPWTYNTPPTAHDSNAVDDLNPRRDRVVIVGDFQAPERSGVKLSGVGSGVSEALSQALLNEGQFDVWSNDKLADAVQQVLDGPTNERESRLGELHEKHPDIRFVIIGQVTDFHHTSEVPPEVRRRSAFIFGTRREAIVAIHFQFVDLMTRRVLLADHVYGTAKAGRKSTEKIYGDLAFGSYLFWNSPLGRATEEAIKHAMSRINEVVPAAPEGTMRVAGLITSRQLQLSGMPRGGLSPSEEYFLIVGTSTMDARALCDPQTGQPLRVRVGSDGTTALLLGQPAADERLVGAELRRDLPAPTEPPVPVAAVGG